MDTLSLVRRSDAPANEAPLCDMQTTMAATLCADPESCRSPDHRRPENITPADGPQPHGWMTSTIATIKGMEITMSQESWLRASRSASIAARPESGQPPARIQRAGVAALGVVLLSAAWTVQAGPREQAQRIHNRLAGVPATDQTLGFMEADIVAGNASDAALRAMDQETFYSVTLKNLVTPWTNTEQNVFEPLNDYTATVIGMVRDDVAFNTLLSADLLYVGSSALGLPAYSMNNNAHYEALESEGHSLRDGLEASTQSANTDIPASATAGVMTTRAAASQFFYLGTNRAMFRFTMLNHMCNDMEQVHDITRPPDRIRQDVTRSPGGDSRIFLNNCVGCHSGMDPLAQAFAYYEWDVDSERMLYAPGQVQGKYFINSVNFKFGFETPDDRWDNYWREGQNVALGWDPTLPGSGTGAKSLGQELANSTAFAQCQVQKVFRTVCFRDAVDGDDRDQIDDMVATFMNDGYQLRQVFADSAVYCMGD